MAHKRVFISVANREHAALRADVRDALTRAGFDVVVQPDFPHTVTDTVRKLDDLIARCDLVVHIVGRDPGSTAPSTAVADFFRDQPRADFLAHHPAARAKVDLDTLTYVQWEPWLALQRKIDVLVYASEGHADPAYPQRAHLDALYADRKHADTLKGPTQQCGQIVADVCVHFGIAPGDRDRIAPSRLTRHAARNFVGRDAELKLLDDAWADTGVHVLSVIAWGGVGKTALINQWINTRMIARGWPDVERYFDWSFYSQGTGDSRQTSSDLFISEALKFFGDVDPTKGSPWERGQRLAGLIRRYRTLLVLDGIEPLQYPPTDRSGQAGRLKDQALEALLQGLAQENNGLCIVTSREHLANIESSPSQREHKLDKLMLDAAIQLIRHLQLTGTDEEIEEMWEALDGHALSMLQLGRLLARGYGRDLRRWKDVGITKADRLHQGRSTTRVMAKYESWLASGDQQRQLELAILRLMGLFEKPMSPGCFQSLREPPAIPGLTERFADVERFEVESAVTTLIENELLSHGGGDDYVGSMLDVSLDAHPLIREYFAAQLKRDRPDAFREAHSRLFDYLCKNTPHRPDTLDGLAPLYEAVTHGCLAGRHSEANHKVYDDRILRSTGSGGFYSRKKLGAIGADLAAVAAFFDEPWSRVSPNLSPGGQAWLLNEAAVLLRALGRLTEALQPMRAGLAMVVRQKVWTNAARGASSLSELEVTLGRLRDAVTNARESITHADQSGDAGMRMIMRTTAADALHQSGQRAEAGDLFAEAERLQQERQPEFDLLYSLQGFKYCDWLLAPAERAAWQHVLDQPLSHSKSQFSDGLTEVQRRATTTLAWVTPQNWLLDIALDHLTLARVGLIGAILDAHPANPQPTLDLPHVADALNGLRAAGQMSYVALSLLTAALYHFVRGEHDLAQKHLAEAQQIAERGPMPLYLADVHLTRARLFRDRDELAKAAKLIREFGYGRRYDELADAERALAARPADQE
jgi:tetratricopeptide (TPR) repeat protein